MLLDSGRLASAVSGTFGDERYLITFSGQAAHAGSTPMRLRRDTLAAAATAALAIREVGIRHDGVTTVGSMRSEPGVITAIAGETEMMLDLRHLDADVLATMLRECLEACEQAAEKFDCTVEARRVFGATPTPFHPELVKIARDAVAEAGGGDGDPIPSGPLHDATEIGRLRADGDDLRPVRSADLAHRGRGLARGRAAGGDQGLRPDRGRRARAGSHRAS